MPPYRTITSNEEPGTFADDNLEVTVFGLRLHLFLLISDQLSVGKLTVIRYEFLSVQY
ncbi:hypothetical protein [Microcystis sp. M31BS1]|uniref:hypothetical protein n=1 Tax=Microcystis sp. M31BS1 TaxID=2771186 RepID=UPI0025827F3D|nr:hypothetical protein [Microcystis sp. M31BS1]